ncbi:uncharacterized protein BX663DRAFT_482660 [Cokeromyces recurvatus]|uniref:uncharacterized protein n=1 Tax=Cokeromyces recurvatus TaxID=90255 RepID=UPI00221FD085|nr:uncharacterized protein BX663DRAFT_482660 [Cokeromyces recurvatus]KAI7906975.1 hypothetical protein BX663DRAFT_482660 [Cokeromyces recurvatus]
MLEYFGIWWSIDNKGILGVYLRCFGCCTSSSGFAYEACPNCHQNGLRYNPTIQIIIGLMVLYFIKKLKGPIILAEFGGSLCDGKKTENDTVKVHRNACRIINELAAKTKKSQIPTVFIVFFHQSKLRFESLKLIDDNVYVRTSHAKIVTAKHSSVVRIEYYMVYARTPYSTPHIQRITFYI